MVIRLARTGSRPELRHILLGSAVVTLSLSLPFLAWSFSRLIESILFSLTRVSIGYPESGLALIRLLGLDGPRIFMLVMIWWIYRQARLAFWASASLTILTSTQLNPVVFTQYYVWLLVAVLLVLPEGLPTAPLAPPDHQTVAP